MVLYDISKQMTATKITWK